MLPPYPLLDLRVDPSPLPLEERRVLRRGAPERLRLDLPAPGSPPVLVAPRAHPPAPMHEGGVREGGGWVRRLAGALRLPAPA